MLNNNYKKKGDINMYFISILILILTFFVYMMFFTGIKGDFVSKSEDLYCRALLSAKSNSMVKAGEFFLLEINQKCKKDVIKESVDDREEVFEVVGDSMNRCWYRYGGGEYDFMSSWKTDGNWCFTCATIEFEDNTDGLGKYSFNDYIEWAKYEKFELQNGSKSTYYDYINMKYTNVSEKDVYELKSDIEELMSDSEGDSVSRDVGIIFSEQYKYLQDLRLKQIDLDDKMYVVYRYDKAKNDVSEEMKNIMIGAGVGFGVGMVVSVVAENIFNYAATGTVCALIGWTGVGTPLCGAMISYSGYKTGATIAEGTYSGVKKFTKIKRIVGKFDDYLKFSKKLDKTKDALKRYDGSVEAMENIVGELDKLDKFGDVSGDMKKVYTKMNDLGYKNILEIDRDLLVKENKLEDFNEVYKYSKDILNKQNFKDIYEEEKLEQSMKIADLNKLQDEIADMEKRIDGMAEGAEKTKDTNKLIENKKQLIYGTTMVVSTATGAYAGASMNFKENQYVDVMSAEQYYRLCGTEPGNFK